MAINYRKAPRPTPVSDEATRRTLAAFIAGGTSDVNRPVYTAPGQTVNLNRLASQRNT